MYIRYPFLYGSKEWCPMGEQLSSLFFGKEIRKKCEKKEKKCAMVLRRTTLLSFLYVYMYECVYIHTYTHIYIYTYIHVYTHMYIYACIHTYMYTHIYIYTCIYTYIHTQTGQRDRHIRDRNAPRHLPKPTGTRCPKP